MKKLVCCFVAFVFGAAVGTQLFAGDLLLVSRKYTDTLPFRKDSLKLDDYIVRKAGKMLLVRAGRHQPLQNDITMNDGSVVRVDGTFIKSNGQSITLDENDKVYISGILESTALK